MLTARAVLGDHELVQSTLDRAGEALLLVVVFGPSTVLQIRLQDIWTVERERERERKRKPRPTWAKSSCRASSAKIQFLVARGAVDIAVLHHDSLLAEIE
jgi:hypothetical protein